MIISDVLPFVFGRRHFICDALLVGTVALLVELDVMLVTSNALQATSNAFTLTSKVFLSTSKPSRTEIAGCNP